MIRYLILQKHMLLESLYMMHVLSYAKVVLALSLYNLTGRLVCSSAVVSYIVA
jgi:hypothetical protein